jgi:1-acyl-sn-glycerol-3-phosphate acyltransferase
MSAQYWIARSIFRVTFRTCFRWRVYHPERVPTKGSVILAANHASFMDPPVVGSAALRGIHYLARESLFRWPGIGWLLRSVNAVPVDREGGVSGLRVIMERLALGEAIVLFPEGTRTYDGNLRPAQAGIGLVVVKSGVPVVPVRLFGTFEAYSRKMRLPRCRPIAIKFGRPISFSKPVEEAKTAAKSRQREIYQEIADEIMRTIAAMRPEPDVA